MDGSQVATPGAPTAPPPLDPGQSLETLDSLARELQNLPVASLAPALLLLLGGLVLLFAGKHFLRPVLSIALILGGALLGPPVLGPLFATDLGSVVLTLLGAVAGLLVAAVAWRLVLGAATGVVAAFACAIAAMLAVDAGLVDARSPTDAPPAEVRLDEVAEREAFIDRSPALVRPLVAWCDARWHREAPQVRTFVGAAAAGGALIGLVLGAWLAQSSAAFLTSLVGAMFTLVGGMPLVARAVDRAAEPIAPIGWLLLWLALAGAGWLVQSSQRDRTPGEKTPPPARTAPPATHPGRRGTT